MIYIVDYGLGNLGSIQNMFKKIGKPSKITKIPKDLEDASKIILPGVGSFDTGMRNIETNGWLEILNKRVLSDGVPTLGICLGMQLMCKSSEEGTLPGLGWLDASVKKFILNESTHKVPQIAWNYADQSKSSKLLDDNFERRRYYFVHSFFVDSHVKEDILMETDYGFTYTSAIEKDNIIGVQFHPEKSHIFGLSLLKNFAENY